jgi:hypothetical protein
MFVWMQYLDACRKGMLCYGQYLNLRKGNVNITFRETACFTFFIWYYMDTWHGGYIVIADVRVTFWRSNVVVKGQHGTHSVYSWPIPRMQDSVVIAEKIVRKFDRVPMFWNDGDKSKLHLRVNKKEVNSGEEFPRYSPEFFIVLSFTKI